MKFIIAIACLLKLTSAFETAFGKCPKVDVLSADELSANLTGKWFDFMKFPSMIFRERCIEIDIIGGENSSLFFNTSGVKNHKRMSQLRSTKLTQYGSMELMFSLFHFSFEFYVLDYEVDQFMVAYTCKNLFGKLAHVDMVWIWSRDKNLDEVYRERALTSLKRNNIDLSPLQYSEQEKCEEYF